MTLLERTRHAGRRSVGARWVLRALGEAAMKNGSRYIASGTRSLSIATGLDHTTVAAHLRALRDEPDPLIDLIENDRGLAGDLYQLRIPNEITVRASTISWRPGKLHALRPVFRELGHPAALVYEALEAQPARPARSFDLITTTGLGRSTIHDALNTLAAWNLIRHDRGRWVLVTGTDLRMLAEQFGCLDQVRAQINRHRDERAAYRRALRVVDRHPETMNVSEHSASWPDPQPPPEIETLLDPTGTGARGTSHRRLTHKGSRRTLPRRRGGPPHSTPDVEMYASVAVVAEPVGTMAVGQGRSADAG